MSTIWQSAPFEFTKENILEEMNTRFKAYKGSYAGTIRKRADRVMKEFKSITKKLEVKVKFSGDEEKGFEFYE